MYGSQPIYKGNRQAFRLENPTNTRTQIFVIIVSRALSHARALSRATRIGQFPLPPLFAPRSSSSEPLARATRVQYSSRMPLPTQLCIPHSVFASLKQQWTATSAAANEQHTAVDSGRLKACATNCRYYSLCISLTAPLNLVAKSNLNHASDQRSNVTASD